MADSKTLTLPGDEPDYRPFRGAVPNLTVAWAPAVDSLIIRAWIPYSAPVGAGGRYIVNIVRPDSTVLYQFVHSATMDAWHQGTRGYHFDVVIPVPQGHAVQVYFDGTMKGLAEWISGHPL